VPLNRRRASYGDTGTTVQRLPYDVIYEQLIPVPSREEQDRINAFIAVLDRKIELNTAMAATLERIAQSVFRSWFVDFDPVKAKMAGEKPVGMDAATAALFPDSMEDSVMGSIPKGFKSEPLSIIGEFRNGLAMQKFPVVDTSSVLPVIKIAQLRAGHTRNADIASGLIDGKFVVADGDVLFSWSGTLEIEHWTGGPGALNQHLFLVLGKSVPNWFIYFASRVHLPEFRNIASSKATTMGHIQRSHLAEALCAVPSRDLTNAADRIFSPLIDKKIALQVEARNLAELRDVLLPELISGEIQIPDEMLFN
jgi:type I restriction enzyme S subunit